MKMYIVFITLVSTFLFLSACGTGTNDDNNQNNVTGNDDAGVGNNEGDTEENADDSSSDSETGNSEDDFKTNEYNSEDESDENNSENANDDSQSVTQETGIYNGQADPHTIEIETEDGPLAFQLTMDAREDVEQLVVGEEVTYTYTEDGDTRTIESIQMKD